MISCGDSITTAVKFQIPEQIFFKINFTLPDDERSVVRVAYIRVSLS